jgi:hypothetical protein
VISLPGEMRRREIVIGYGKVAGRDNGVGGSMAAV